MANKPYLPYGRQQIDEDDITAVVEVLRSDWLTTGPMVERFEQAVCDYTGASYGVAVSSGTAALHAAMFAIGIGPGDEVILPPMTFVATANAVVYLGGTPIFVDVEADTLLIDATLVEAKITPRTKAIIAVDYAGQPCDYNTLREIADRHGLYLVADACHSLGAEYKGRKVGTLADLTVFSFHPVKPITTGEGGMVVTESQEFADRMRGFRNHGIDCAFPQRCKTGGHSYQMLNLGYNYRLSDLHCALGVSQLVRLDAAIERRQGLAGQYRCALALSRQIRPLVCYPEARHGYHLFVVRVGSERDRIFTCLKQCGIGVNVHYPLLHLHPFYRQHHGGAEGLCPVAELLSREILTLPLFPQMRDEDVLVVAATLTQAASTDSQERRPHGTI